MLARIPLAYTAFEGPTGGPPRPVMYAAHARDTKAACMRRPEVLLTGMQKLWARFFSPENLTLQDAVAVVHRPREGSIYRPWGRLRVETEDLFTGPAPRAADLAGTPLRLQPEALHIKFNSENAKGLVRNVPNPDPLEKNFWNRVAEGSAKATWDRHKAVGKSFKKFCDSEGLEVNFPLDTSIVKRYASWCDIKRNMKASSIKTYLYSLSKIQQLKGLGPIELHKVPQIRDFLRGVKNRPSTLKKDKKKRKVVSFKLLKAMGAKIGASDWTDYDKTLTWTAYLVCYFGSLRVGEIIGSAPMKYDVDQILCWNDVTFTADGIQLNLRSPKVQHPGGDIIFLFPFPTEGLCPVKAMKRLRERARVAGLLEGEKPVFRLSNGSCWSRADFNKTLESVVGKLGQKGEGEVTGHSFRGGIASVLATEATPEAETALKEWGRWRSNAFKSYTQFHIRTRKEIFNKVTKLLLCNPQN